MSEITTALVANGWPGAVLLVVAFIVAKLIDRGFRIEVPPKRGR